MPNRGQNQDQGRKGRQQKTPPIPDGEIEDEVLEEDGQQAAGQDLPQDGRQAGQADRRQRPEENVEQIEDEEAEDDEDDQDGLGARQ